MTLEELAARKCVPCRGTKPMTRQEAEQILRDLQGWRLKDDSIEKEFRFHSYLEGLGFACSLGKIAEEQNHHPDMLLRWRRVIVTLSTHVIKGLSMNDFIMAARAELKYLKYRTG